MAYYDLIKKIPIKNNIMLFSTPQTVLQNYFQKMKTITFLYFQDKINKSTI